MPVLDQADAPTEILPELIAPLAAEYAHLGYATEDARLLALLRDVAVMAAWRRRTPGCSPGTALAQVLAEAALTLTATGDLTLCASLTPSDTGSTAAGSAGPAGRPAAPA
jgi:hypothetical protein